jgi:SAM-dependent methyltransferase
LVDGQVTRVQKYYDANTASFERYGQSGDDGAVHRAVWAPGVTTRPEAFHHVDALIAADIDRLDPRFGTPTRVLDFGCGLGASLIWLASRRDITGHGVTVSRIQARRAAQRVRDANLSQRLHCLESDFLALPTWLTPSHLVFSIEAFVHCPTATSFFESAAQQLAPGGTLIICDDFATERSEGPLSEVEARWLREFRHGWVAPSLVTTAAANAAATNAGFDLQHSIDLTPYLELERPRDILLSRLIALARHLPVPGYRWRSLVGGNALQRALKLGLIEYRYLAWTRRSG